MSSAKARRSASSAIALPPYLTTTIAFWNSCSHGRASASTAALACASSGEVAGHRGGALDAGHVEYALFSST